MPFTHGEGKPYGRAVASQLLAESIIFPSPHLYKRQGLKFCHRSSYGSELVKFEDKCTLAIVCPRPPSCWLARMWGGGMAGGDTSYLLPATFSAAPSPCPLSSWGLRYNPEGEGRKRETGRVMPLRTLLLKPASAHGSCSHARLSL